ESAARSIAPEADDPTGQISNTQAAARLYGHFANGMDPNYDAEKDDADGIEIDRDALEALKERFLDKFPDFESGGGFAGLSSYHTAEDDYNRHAILTVEGLLADNPSTQKLGVELLALLVDDNDLNLIGDYRRKNHLKAVRERSQG